MKRTTLGIAVATLLALAGCATQQSPGTTPAPDAGQIAIKTARALGAGCLVLTDKLNATELEQARAANKIALAVMAQPSPDLGELAGALQAASLPKQYAVLGAVLVQQLKDNFGDQLPVDSAGWQAATAFLQTCQTALGESA